MSDDRDEIVGYRMARAFEAFGAAKALTKINDWSSVANRLYYACFYAVSALLLKKGLYAKTHSGTKTLFHQEFVKPQLMQAAWGKFYQDLFDLRNEGDYVDMVVIREEKVLPLLPEAENFLNEMKRLLDTI